MKGFRFFIKSLILVLILSAVAFAQTEKTPTGTKDKIVIIDTDFLAENESGVRRLREAYRNAVLKDEKYDDAYLSLMAQEKDLRKQIDLLIAQNKSITEEYVKLQKINLELTKLVNDRTAVINTKIKMTVQPIYEEIRKKVKEFAALKGYSVILDKSFTNFLVEGEITDVTREFAEFCNEAFDKEKKQ